MALLQKTECGNKQLVDALNFIYYIIGNMDLIKILLYSDWTDDLNPYCSLLLCYAAVSFMTKLFIQMLDQYVQSAQENQSIIPAKSPTIGPCSFFRLSLFITTLK